MRVTSYVAAARNGTTVSPTEPLAMIREAPSAVTSGTPTTGWGHAGCTPRDGGMRGSCKEDRRRASARSGTSAHIGPVGPLRSRRRPTSASSASSPAPETHRTARARSRSWGHGREPKASPDQPLRLRLPLHRMGTWWSSTSSTTAGGAREGARRGRDQQAIPEHVGVRGRAACSTNDPLTRALPLRRDARAARRPQGLCC